MSGLTESRRTLIVSFWQDMYHMIRCSCGFALSPHWLQAQGSETSIRQACHVHQRLTWPGLCGESPDEQSDVKHSRHRNPRQPI
eukprot:scaffold168044_cov20-Prasinocladus_malaysianus.AAC.1